MSDESENESPGKRRKKGKGPSDAVTIEERRRKVYDLLLRGLPETAIATLMKVHRNTIVNDVRAIRDEMRERASKTDPFTEIGTHIRFMEEMRTQALYEYHNLTDEKAEMRVQQPDGTFRMERRITRSQSLARSKFLEQAMKANDAIIALQMKTGLLPKVTNDLDEDDIYTMEGVDIRKMSKEALEQLQEKMQARVAERKLRVMQGGKR